MSQFPPRARKRFGQNFLVDRRAVGKICERLAPEHSEGLLEIGPGRGALTAELIERWGRIAAVELDLDLCEALRSRFDHKQLVLLQEDVLKIDLRAVCGLLGVCGRSRLAIAGNLPYNISKPVAMLLVSQRRAVSRAVLMFQREVADRLTAGPGSRSYGPLTILTGMAYRIERVFDLSPAAFRPKPAVFSTVTLWRRREEHGPDEVLMDRTRACLKASFTHRRRTMLNNLGPALPGGKNEALQLLQNCGIDPGLRPEQVDPDAYLLLADRWPLLS